MPDGELLRPAAVCVLGAWRSFELTAPTIRKHVLEPLNADAFAVLERRSGMHAVDSTPVKSCTQLLGPRVTGRCRVVSGLASLDSDVAVATARNMLHGKTAERCFSRAFPSTSHQRRVWLQQLACYRMVRRAEYLRSPYAVYVRLRSDMAFFESLPAAFLHPFGASEAAVPAGDNWGIRGTPAVCDNMLVGGSTSFEVDANVWRHAAEDRFCERSWISEQFLSSALTVKSIAVTRPPLAYCKLSRRGACHYVGQLALVHERVPTLVERRPALAEVLCSKAPLPCSASLSAIPQTTEDHDGDPGFCTLRHRLDPTCVKLARPKASAPRVRVLALVLSSDSMHARAIRQRIRASWMAALPATMRALFVIGGLTGGVVRVNGSLANGDELFLATDDSYKGGSAKVLDALAWAERHSDSFDYLLKVDDDTFVCPRMMVEWLQWQRRDRLYAGHPQYFEKGSDGQEYSIPIFKEGRWADEAHARIFGVERYARYMLGGGYVLSSDAVRSVTDNARAHGLFGTTLRREGRMPTMEDALIGRLLASSAEHVIMPAFAAAFPSGEKDSRWAHPEERCQQSSILFHPINFSVVGPLLFIGPSGFV